MARDDLRKRPSLSVGVWGLTQVQLRMKRSCKGEGRQRKKQKLAESLKSPRVCFLGRDRELSGSQVPGAGPAAPRLPLAQPRLLLRGWTNGERGASGLLPFPGPKAKAGNKAEARFSPPPSVLCCFVVVVLIRKGQDRVGGAAWAGPDASLRLAREAGPLGWFTCQTSSCSPPAPLALLALHGLKA